MEHYNERIFLSFRFLGTMRLILYDIATAELYGRKYIVVRNSFISNITGILQADLRLNCIEYRWCPLGELGDLGVAKVFTKKKRKYMIMRSKSDGLCSKKRTNCTQNYIKFRIRLLFTVIIIFYSSITRSKYISPQIFFLTSVNCRHVTKFISTYMYVHTLTSSIWTTTLKNGSIEWI